MDKRFKKFDIKGLEEDEVVILLAVGASCVSQVYTNYSYPYHEWGGYLENISYFAQIIGHPIERVYIEEAVNWLYSENYLKSIKQMCMLTNGMCFAPNWVRYFTMGIKQSEIIKLYNGGNYEMLTSEGMKNYVGCKLIKARLATYGEYRKVKYPDRDFKSVIVSDETEGYIVMYPPIGDEAKPFYSWSPKEVFEKAYRVVEDCEVSMLLE